MFRKDVAAPVAKRVLKTITFHDDTRTDDYHWLRERDNPEVVNYLAQENAYLESVLAPTKNLQEQLYQKILSHLQETDTYVPVQDGPYFYYTRTEQGKQYAIHCRKKASSRSELENVPEEIILDVNELARGKTFLSVTLIKPSPDHSKLAYLQNETGSDRYTVYIKDLVTGELLSEHLENVYIGGSLEWSTNEYLFYVTINNQQRPYRLYRHRLGESTDTLLYEETDAAFYLYLSQSDSKDFLFAHSGSHVTSEIRYLPTQTPLEEWCVFAPRVHGIEYSLEHHGQHFLISTNEDALNFKLLTTPIDKTAREQWQEILPHSEKIYLRGMQVFEDQWLITGREDGLTQLWVYDVKSATTKRLGFPDAVYTTLVYDNRDFYTHKALISYQSMLTPYSVLELDLNTLETTLLKREPVPNYDAKMYSSERLWAIAPDGAQVPLSIVYKKDMPKPTPVLLYGYGAYGASIDPTFSANRLALLDNGVAFAIAHPRGGTDMGRHWYQQGKLLHKKNTFTDFVACAEHLISQSYTTADKLAAMGVSAGGLLMGAVANLCPHLFKAIIAKVPFVDVINTSLDPSLPLVATEYDEWGNPNDINVYHYLKSYSPYDNVEAKNYPHLLVTAGLNDPRVAYWEPAKWVAKLRATKTDQNVILFKTYLQAGHGGSSGRYDYLREVALEYAFVLTAFMDDSAHNVFGG